MLINCLGVERTWLNLCFIEKCAKFATVNSIYENNMNKIIAQNLKAFRNYNRFTQDQVAEFLGLKNRSTYSNYESGDREAPLEVLEKCADIYGCDLSQFFEEDDSSVKEMLVCAFRVDDIELSDMKEIAAFKSIVKNYMKLNSLLAK